VLRGSGIEVEGLRVELRGELHDLTLVDCVGVAREPLADHEILEIEDRSIASLWGARHGVSFLSFALFVGGFVLAIVSSLILASQPESDGPRFLFPVKARASGQSAAPAVSTSKASRAR
jgi:hypothetical protein